MNATVMMKTVAMMFATAALALALLGNVNAAYANNIDPNQLFFVSSGLWHQYENDKDDRIFRFYAFAMDAKQEPVDVPNLMVLNCGEQTPYLTLHFPENYAFHSFKPVDWLPETTLYARNEGSTFKFKAELNRNEISVDLPGNEANLDALLMADSYEFRFGPEAADRVVVATDRKLLESEVNFVSGNTVSTGKGKIIGSSDWKAIASCGAQPGTPAKTSTSAPGVSVQAATPPASASPNTSQVSVFRFDGGRVSLTEKPDQRVKVGETLSLSEIGRRFPDASVSAAYEQGEDEIEYFKVASGTSEVHVHYDKKGTITRIEASSPGVADPNGMQVGGSVATALGSRAYCNTFTEDEPVFCKASENAETRYDVEWSDTCSLPEQTAAVVDVPACAKISAISISAPQSQAAQRFAFGDFPASSFRGKTALPSFKGRDKKFRDYRTRITNALKEGPNFAGNYSLVQIGCGSGCSFMIVANNANGQVFGVPRGGEDNMYLQTHFKPDSRLLVLQWANYDTQQCYVEYLEWTGAEARPLSKAPVGGLEACYRGIAENVSVK